MTVPSAHIDGTPRRGMIARVAAVASLAAAMILVVLLLLGSGPTTRCGANFQDCGGLVTGDDVLIGPAKVGSVQSIGLTRDGQAEVTFSVDNADARGHGGADLRELAVGDRQQLRGPRARSRRRAADRDGGMITRNHTYSSVNLDQLFDTLTR